MAQAELRKKFVAEALEAAKQADEGNKSRVLVTVVQLPSGALETITNTEHIESKLLNLLERYDEEFRHFSNPAVKIIGYLLV